MTQSPDQSDQVIPRDFRQPEPAPLDAGRYKPGLSPVVAFPTTRPARAAIRRPGRARTRTC